MNRTERIDQSFVKVKGKCIYCKRVGLVSPASVQAKWGPNPAVETWEIAPKEVGMFSCQMGQKSEGEIEFFPQDWSLFSSQPRGFAHLDMAKDFPLLIDLLDFSTPFFLIFIDELAESAEAIVQVCSPLSCWPVFTTSTFMAFSANFGKTLRPRFLSLLNFRLHEI